jgi:hypothetical protein
MRDKLIEYFAEVIILLIYAVVIYFIVNILFKPLSYVDAGILAGCVRFIEWRFK